MYDRVLPLSELVGRKSQFLLGPRQTGKSTLLRRSFPDARYVDLLNAVTFRQLSARPETLRESLEDRDTIILIDEIQKLPSLLDEVQLMIDADPRRRFVLTGSSARKLKDGRANLLAGRAWSSRLHPLVSPEVGYENLDRRLSYGSLPSVLDSEFPLEELKAYVGTYLQEEIRSEGVTRNIEGFSRFLDTAGLANGEVLNYTKIGNDAGIPPRTVRDYFQALEDTLVGMALPPMRSGSGRKAVATSKFYFFDVGVANALLKRGPVEPGSESFGRALEHLVFLELRAFVDYRRLDMPIEFWGLHGQAEVDFVVGREIAIEVKGTGNVSPQDLRGLRQLDESHKLRRRIVVCSEPTPRRTADGIDILPVQEFLRELWENNLGMATPA